MSFFKLRWDVTCEDSLDRVILKLQGTSKRLEGCKGKGVARETPLACSPRRLKSTYLLVQPLLHKSGFGAALVLISKTSAGLYGREVCVEEIAVVEEVLVQ